MKNKLKLDRLEVQSFITSETKNELKGGAVTLNCLTGVYPTINVNVCLSKVCTIFPASEICVPTQDNVGICQRTRICLTGTETSPSFCDTIAC